jgi:hypothetical protein
MYWRRFIMLIDYPLFTFSESPVDEAYALINAHKAASHPPSISSS